MLVTFIYYDPTGKYNESFQRQLPKLKSVFNSICLSVVPPTAKNNADFVRYLQEQGCLMVHNNANLQYGIHSREALRLALENAKPQESIFFGFENRILFALETQWQNSFLQDIRAHHDNDCVIFERSQTAWETHPQYITKLDLNKCDKSA